MTSIAICVPSRDQVHAAFAFDLASMVGRFVQTGNSVFLFQSQGTLICNQRQSLAEQAIEAGAEWILYLDSDMRFPMNAIERLLARGEPVVAANYSTRRAPIHPVAFASDSLKDYVYTSPESEGLEPVHAVGMGVFLVRTDVLKSLPKPWFQIGFARQSEDYIGEDIYFCRLLREHGHKVLIDHDLSKEVAHIGTFEFLTDHACIIKD